MLLDTLGTSVLGNMVTVKGMLRTGYESKDLLFK